MNNIFFFFSKILTIFIYPLPFVILLGIISIFFISGKKNKIISSVPLIFLFIFSIFPVSQSLIGILEKDHPPIAIDSLEKSDYIVVLGGAINILGYHRDRIEFGSSAERMTDAILLYKANKAEKIIFTGGSGILFQQNYNEAYYAKKFFLDFGIPQSDLIFEDKSKNTYENGVYTKEKISNFQNNKIILITSAFHMERSVRIFRKLGFQVQEYPTDYKMLMYDINFEYISPNTGYLEISTIAIKEIIGLIAYYIKGYI